MRSQPGTEQSFSFLFLRARFDPLLDVVELDRVGVGFFPTTSGKRVSIGGGRALVVTLDVAWLVLDTITRTFFS